MVTAMTLRAGLILLSVGVSLLAACGGQPHAATASSPSMRQATTVGSTAGEQAGSADAATPSSDSPEAITEFTGFTSPSGNVGCYIDPTGARCDISERDWSPPPRPADCEFDYGQGISVSPGENATFVCAGDTALGGDQPLAYGRSISAGVLVCDSAESGITCRDTKTGHGFAIAREGYRVF
jgi:hypothetical protein